MFTIFLQEKQKSGQAIWILFFFMILAYWNERCVAIERCY